MEGFITNILNHLNKQYQNNVNNEIIQKYIDYVGKDNFETLQNRFNSDFMFENRWNQVITTRSTLVTGTGLGTSSVFAEYKKIDEDKNIFSVENFGLNESFKPIRIEGITFPRSLEVKTCRIVNFNTNDVEGNYWVAYISRDLKTIIVAFPLFIPNTSILITPNFACSILTQKNYEDFWNDKEGAEEILTECRKLGFTNFLNKPLGSANTLSIDKNLATIVSSPTEQIN
jgi:hypothetical protein